MQTLRSSLIEATVNTILGFIISGLINYNVFLAYNIELTLVQNGAIVALFTLTSMLRNFLVRRGFNWLHIKGILK